jgi:hypothetical protein
MKSIKAGWFLTWRLCEISWETINWFRSSDRAYMNTSSFLIYYKLLPKRMLNSSVYHFRSVRILVKYILFILKRLISRRRSMELGTNETLRYYRGLQTPSVCCAQQVQGTIIEKTEFCNSCFGTGTAFRNYRRIGGLVALINYSISPYC